MMEKKTEKMIALLAVGTVAVVFNTFGAIVSYSSEFASADELEGWKKVQDAPDTKVQWHSDEAMVINVQDKTVGNESVGYTLDGTMDAGDKIEADVRLVNLRNNYYKARVQLWNATDNVLLAESDEILMYGANDAHGRYQPVEVSLKYKVPSDSKGAVLQLRLKEQCNGPHRNLAVDSVSVSSR